MLVIVLGTFGGTAYFLERDNRFTRIDRELQQRVSTLADALRPGAPLSRLSSGGPGGFPPPPRAEGRRPAWEESGWAPGRPPPDIDFESRLSSDLQTALGSIDWASFYYTVWSPSGKVLARSANAPAELSAPEGERTLLNNLIRARGTLREMAYTTRRGFGLVVGRDIAPDLGELRRRAWLLGAAGVAILAVGLAGGWLLASRAIRPIAGISLAAQRVAEGNLAERIKASETDSELGQLAGLLNTMFDRLQAAFSRQAQLTADASHELRTPVSVILTQTQTTLSRDRAPAEYRESLAACQRAAQRMRRLIESLLELARLDAGQKTMKRVRFDLGQTAAECIELVRPLAEEHGVTVDSDLPETACDGDPEHMAQVITNLLSNAIQYNQHGGNVHVTTACQNGSALLTVSNTGPGIAPEDLPHVFERFYRGDKARSGTAGRAGLGLAIARAIVEAHGGTIDASSQPAVSTTFRIQLPVRPGR